MIQELMWFGAFWLAVACACRALRERKASERRHVNWLADRSRGRKATAMRDRCRYAEAYMNHERRAA